MDISLNVRKKLNDKHFAQQFMMAAELASVWLKFSVLLPIVGMSRIIDDFWTTEMSIVSISVHRAKLSTIESIFGDFG